MRSQKHFGIAAFAFALYFLTGGPAFSADLRSKQSGPWSAKETWDARRVPQKGDRVVIRSGHSVAYDIDSREVIRLVQIAGTLDFARDKNTRLEAGLITVTASEEPSEEGFDCHASPKMAAHGKGRPALYIGKPGQPFPRLGNARFGSPMSQKSSPRGPVWLNFDALLAFVEHTRVAFMQLLLKPIIT